MDEKLYLENQMCILVYEYEWVLGSSMSKKQQQKFNAKKQHQQNVLFNTQLAKGPCNKNLQTLLFLPVNMCSPKVQVGWGRLALLCGGGFPGGAS